jgi:hypothetical protein
MADEASEQQIEETLEQPPQAEATAPEQPEPKAPDDDGGDPPWLPERLKRQDKSTREALAKEAGFASAAEMVKAAKAAKEKAAAEMSEVERLKSELEQRDADLERERHQNREHARRDAWRSDDVAGKAKLRPDRADAAYKLAAAEGLIEGDDPDLLAAAKRVVQMVPEFGTDYVERQPTTGALAGRDGGPTKAPIDDNRRARRALLGLREEA